MIDPVDALALELGFQERSQRVVRKGIDGRAQRGLVAAAGRFPGLAELIAFVGTVGPGRAAEERDQRNDHAATHQACHAEKESFNMGDIVTLSGSSQQVLLLLILFALTGLVAGVLAGLLGIGGGLVIVPALAFILRWQGADVEIAVPMAVATSLGTMLLTSASAIWFHDRRHGIDWPVVARLGPAVAGGALLGALLAAQLPGLLLGRIFAVLAAVIGLRMLLAVNPPQSDRAPFPRAWALIGPLIGAVSAIMGIGGGSFNVPYLARNGFPMVRAVAIASACGWPIALGGLLGFVIAGWGQVLFDHSIGYVHLPGLIVIGLGGALGAPAGVALAHRLPATHLKRIFGFLLLVIAVRMAW
ncbi:MAG: sulfite exporter TauE/SafE family protein [Wenzhouxiangella sp.]|nr:MAG: sulfite exporter TauE/SafE family protein [Wenzhouxiangella sp.]